MNAVTPQFYEEKTSEVHASEQGHWYSKAGDQVYKVPYADPKKGLRPTTLRDARKLELVPSVTGINRTLASQGLIQYFETSLLTAAWDCSVRDDEMEFRRWVSMKAKEHARDAAAQGTIGHVELQSHFEGGPVTIKYLPLVQNAEKCLKENCGEQQWIAEKSFAHKLGYGGKVDLHSDSWIIDFKGTDKPMEELKTWDEHAMQLAAYRNGLDFDFERCAILYFHRETFEVRLIEIDEKDLERGWEMFKGLLTVWKAQKRYWP